MSRFESIQRVLERHPDVRLAYVFGSVARGHERVGSDVDIAILFQNAPAPATVDRLAIDLQRALHRAVDLVVLNSAPPLLAREAITGGRLIVCRDEDERVCFEARALARYLDTAHLRCVQYAYLRERAETYHARPGCDVERWLTGTGR
jgi:predicted nucleotidyltransferase